MRLDHHVALGGDSGNGGVDQVAGAVLVIGSARPKVDPENGKVRNDIARTTPIDPRRIDAEAWILARSQVQREVRRRQERVAAVLRIAAGVGGAAAHHQGEIAAPRARPGEGSVGKRGRFIGQRRALASGCAHKQIG